MVQDLPPMPQVVSKIIQIGENNITLSSDQLQSLIAVDPALTSKILRIANSAFYARARKVSNLSEAITLLGFKTIKSLTLLVSTSDLFKKSKSNKNLIKELWMRSVLTALIGKIIAEKSGNQTIKDEVFMAGLLKNIGQMLLLNKYPAIYNEIFKQSGYGVDLKKLDQLEKKEFQINSMEISALAMKQWNFPENLIEISEYCFDKFEQAKKSRNLLIVITLTGELVVLCKDLTGQGNISEDAKEQLLEKFSQFADELSLKKVTRDYLLEGVVDLVHEDEFFTFCEELFSM